MKTPRLYLCLDCSHTFRHMDEHSRRCPGCGSENSKWKRAIKAKEYQERVRNYNKANGIKGRFQEGT